MNYKAHQYPMWAQVYGYVSVPLFLILVLVAFPLAVALGVLNAVIVILGRNGLI